MTPAEIIYQRRIAVLEYAERSGQRGRGLPGLRHLEDPLLRVEEPWPTATASRP